MCKTVSDISGLFIPISSLTGQLHSCGLLTLLSAIHKKSKTCKLKEFYIAVMIHSTFIDPPKTYTQDGVCLTESGMSQLQSLTVTVPRRKRTKPKLKLKIINQNSVAVLQTPPDAQSEHSRDGEMDDSRGSSLLLACLVAWSVAVPVCIANIPGSFYYTDTPVFCTKCFMEIS